MGTLTSDEYLMREVGINSSKSDKSIVKDCLRDCDGITEGVDEIIEEIMISNEDKGEKRGL